MLKKPLEVVAPIGIGEDFVCEGEEREAYEYFKGVIHAVAPFAIGIVSVKIALIYFFCVFVLYSTVFIKKSAGFFGSLAIIAVFTIGLLMPS